MLLGNGDGTLQAATTFEVGVNPRGVPIGDMNGDIWPDLVVADDAPVESMRTIGVDGSAWHRERLEKLWLAYVIGHGLYYRQIR